MDTNNNNHSGYWSKNSWQSYQVTHLPFWQNQYTNECKSIIKNNIFNKLIISAKQITEFKNSLSNIVSTNGFIVQMGDCAEMFNQANTENILNRISLINSISNTINNKNVIKIGRMGGQYAKPRNEPQVSINNKQIYNYFGDIFNDFNVINRDLNPTNMLTAHKNALFTNQVIQKTDNSIYTSHEALNLFYEEALTHTFEDKNYNTSAHMLWLGDKTRFLGSAHVEYLRGIENPIGIKLSNNITPSNFVEICKLINPHNTLGKIIVINRMGVQNTKILLDDYIKQITTKKLNVLYMLDPMHGNNKVVNGIKTRLTRDMQQEIKDFNDILKQNKQYFSGIHLETTHEDVYECNITDESINNKYLTTCDPRLNPTQTKDLILYLNNILLNKK